MKRVTVIQYIEPPTNLPRCGPVWVFRANARRRVVGVWARIGRRVIGVRIRRDL